MHSTTTVIYTLSLHDALPIYLSQGITLLVWFTASIAPRDIRRRQVARSTGQSKSSSEFRRHGRSEEHTSELQSLRHLVCRLLLEKKKQTSCSTGKADD